MNAITSPRASAREELAALTQQRVLQAVAELLRHSHEEVTFEAVARESGVPQRTLYRHFPNKEALFSAFWRWLNEQIETPTLPTSPEEVVSQIPALFAAFDRDEALVRAMLHHPSGRAVRLAHAEARRHKFAQALREITERLTEDPAQRLLASVTVLCSASGWETMRDNWDLSGIAAAEAAQWAVQALIDNARELARTNPAEAQLADQFTLIEGNDRS
jgi:AcrR family transcriptional regulator